MDRISEVLAERGEHILRRKVASDPDRGIQLASTRCQPLSRGFERDSWVARPDQWYPELVYDKHPVEAPATGRAITSKDLADKTMEFIRDSPRRRRTSPGSPICARVPGTPCTTFKEWSDKYAGMFDMGYERYREIVLENQKKLGIVPADTELSPINPYLDVKGPTGQPWPLQDTVRPWDGLSDEEKRLFARMAEVFAGFLPHRRADRPGARLSRGVGPVG